MARSRTTPSAQDKIHLAEVQGDGSISADARKAGCPARLPRGATFVLSYEIVTGPFLSWKTELLLSTNRSRSAWFLWARFDAGEGVVVEPAAWVASRAINSREEAAQALALAFLQHEGKGVSQLDAAPFLPDEFVERISEL